MLVVKRLTTKLINKNFSQASLNWESCWLTTWQSIVEGNYTMGGDINIASIDFLRVVDLASAFVDCVIIFN